MRRHEIAPWLPLAILTGAVLIICIRLVFGEVLYWGLPSLQYYPWRQFAFNELRQGRFPAWNPYSGGGTPLIANYQSAILYPPNWLHLLLPNGQAMSILAIVHLLWAGLGMWFFTKDLGLNNLARGISLLSFTLGGYLFGQIGDLALENTAAWLPWLFFATMGVLNRRQPRYVGLLGIFAGFQLLAGNLQTSWYSFIAVFFFTLWYILWPLRPLGRGEQITAFTLVSFGILIGVGIASSQLILTSELLWQSHRSGGVDYGTLSLDSFAPWRLITLVAPKLFGSPSNGSLLEPNTSSYAIIRPYIGLLPIISVIYAVRGWQKKRSLLARLEVFQSVPFWLFMGSVGFILAFGRYTPIYRFLYENVPTFDGFRDPERWLILSVFALSILAGIGIHNWQASPQQRSRIRLGWPAVIGGLVGITIMVNLVSIEGPTGSVLTTALVSLIILLSGIFLLSLNKPQSLQVKGAGRWQVAVLLLVVMDLSWAVSGTFTTAPRAFYERELSVSRPQGRLYWDEDHEKTTRNQDYFDISDFRIAKSDWAAIRTSLIPNLNMIDRVATFNNFDPLQPSIHRQYVELIENANGNRANLLKAAGIGEIYGGTPPLGWEGEDMQYSTPITPPTTWLVKDVRWIEDNEFTKALMQTEQWNPATTVLMDEDLVYPHGVQPLARYESALLEVVRELPSERRYRIQSDGSGYLVVATTWYPGWEARVNGRKTKIYRANLTFMAIEVPPGDVQVELTYTPTGIELSLFLSIASLFGAVGIIALDLFRHGY